MRGWLPVSLPRREEFVTKPVVYAYVHKETGVVTPRLHLRIDHVLDLGQVIDGLCSRYWTNYSDGREVPPETLTATEILDAVRNEYASYGLSNVWSWCDGVDYEVKAREWATERIREAIPDLMEGQRTTSERRWTRWG